VDDAGHDKNIDMKIKFIEKSDEMIKYLIINLQKNKNELNVHNFLRFLARIYYMCDW
jgi:2,3-bisphosphoglycerate-independent phosphoglycerate mutase